MARCQVQRFGILLLSEPNWQSTSSIHLPLMPSPSYRASASPSSPSVSVLKQGNNKVDDFFHNHGHSHSQRRLTRQRKLRHVSDEDLGFHSSHRFRSSPCSPDFARKLKSVLASAGSDHWSSSAVPQPLPLPEASLPRRPDSTSREGSGSPVWRWASLFFFSCELNLFKLMWLSPYLGIFYFISFLLLLLLLFFLPETCYLLLNIDMKLLISCIFRYWFWRCSRMIV